MHPSTFSQPVLAATLILTLTSGCGQSKASQCQAIIAEGQRGQQALEAIDFDKPAQLKASMAEWRESNAKVVALPLEDNHLKEVRARYVKANADSADTLQKALAVGEQYEHAGEHVASLEAQAKALTEKLEALEKENHKAIDDLNVYCTGSK